MRLSPVLFSSYSRFGSTAVVETSETPPPIITDPNDPRYVPEMDTDGIDWQDKLPLDTSRAAIPHFGLAPAKGQFGALVWSLFKDLLKKCFG